jgi:DNA-binding GntR family transcriptional regulator
MLSAPRPPQSLAEKAYDAIKGRILSLELKPGQFINQLALCETVKMGRMPVHQAVHRLMTEGLLKVIPRKGIIIGAESANEVLEALEARGAVEPNIAALAAQRATPAQLTQMDKLLRQSRKVADQRFRREFMDLDRLFHAAVAEAAGNQMLVDAQRPLQERSARIWSLVVMRHPDGLRMTQEEHEAVFDAIRRGDRDGARRAMQVHLASLRRRMVDGTDPI